MRRLPPDIEVIVFWNNGELPIGTIRQRLLTAARGEYICFIDDDDRIAGNYCSKILAALGEDYVGFKVKLFEDGVELPPAIHNLAYPNWHQDEKGFYRDVTHLNPIRRSLAHQGDFFAPGGGEDESWARRVKPYVHTQNFIDEFLYFYHHSKTDTAFGGHHFAPKRYKRPKLSYPNFRYHPASRLAAEVNL
jgi:glycosyltransferase involved in cell wall biosynthesis